MEQVEKLIECKGYLSQVEDSQEFGFRQHYTWKKQLLSALDLTMDETATFSFANNVLVQKNFSHYGGQFSHCTPTQAEFDKIQINSQLADAERAVGCAPRLHQASLSSLSQQREYAWGFNHENQAGNFVTVTLDQQGRIQSKSLVFQYE